MNPQPGDEIRISLGAGVWLKYSGFVDVQEIYLRGGNTYFSFPISIDRNGQTTSYRDSVYLPAWDTTYHKIEY